jgi:hypothetical protein
MLVDGDITLNAPIDLSGTAPDGAGGLADLEAGGSFTQNPAAPLLAGGGDGTDSGGGDVSYTSGTDMLVGAIDVSGGGFGGGSIDCEGEGLTTVAGESNADGDDAGDITFIGLTVNVLGNVHAAAQPGGSGGTISMAGCELDVPQGASMLMSGSASGALLQASGPMTIGGSILSDGPNSFQYLSIPPTILHSAVIRPPTPPTQNPALPTCDKLFPDETTTTTIPGATTTTTSTLTTTTTIPGATTTTSTSLSTTSSSTVSTTSTSTVTTTTVSTTTVSTTTVTTTSTSSSTSSSTLSTVVTTTSTTSSTRPECTATDASACDDGDGCTVDSCSADGRCVHDQKTGVDGVTCKLEALDADLTAAGSTNLGGAARAAALIGKVSRARTLVEASRPLTGRKRLKKLKGAGKQMTAFEKLVHKGQAKGKIAAATATALLDVASDAASGLQQLITP